MLRTRLLTAAVTLVLAHSAVAAIGTQSKAMQINPGIHTVAQRPLTPNANPRIAPRNSTNHGRTYGEWGAAFFQWGLSIPDDRNPFGDPDGRFCSEGQTGPVWFLASSFGISVDRWCSIPAGKAIFMVVGAVIAGAGAYDCDPSAPGVPCDVASLRATAAAILDASSEFIEVTIDGARVNNIREYRAVSPQPFSVLYPENSVMFLPAGTYYPNVSDGYWLMLNPLPQGSHTITTTTVSAPAGLDYTVTWHLTVE